MDVYLYGSDAPPLMYSFDITQKVFHRRVGLDVHHTFTNWATLLTDTQLAFLVRKLHVLLLHRPASPSEEPTTTKAKLVVIVGYIKGKPLSVRYSLRLPLSSVKEGFYHRLRYGWHRPIQGRVHQSAFAVQGSSLSSVAGFFQPLPSGLLYT